MTPLHWAVYHKDARLVNLLLKYKAEQKLNYEGLFPVDIAGIAGNLELVKLFASSLENDLRSFQGGESLV